MDVLLGTDLAKYLIIFTINGFMQGVILPCNLFPAHETGITTVFLPHETERNLLKIQGVPVRVFALFLKPAHYR
jgi:hypothetical protein